MLNRSMTVRLAIQLFLRILLNVVVGGAGGDQSGERQRGRNNALREGITIHLTFPEHVSDK